MREEDPPLERLRCKRTDGRQWRCKRQAMDGKTLCNIHHLQGKHRQNKQKVPESLKLERKVTKKTEEGRLNVGVLRLKEIPYAAESRKRRNVSEALDSALKRMKLKRGDLHLELIREFLKRQVEKKKEKDLKDSFAEDKTKNLPYGIMAISQSPAGTQNLEECNGGLDAKIGVKLHENSLLQRHFRSKNIEPLPIGTMQVVPFAELMKKRKIRKCHWCKESKGRVLVKCLACRKRFFCMRCIKERYIDKLVVKMKCPACCGTCRCNICEKLQNRAINLKECYRGKRKIDKIQLLHYLISMLLPVLRQINLEQGMELEKEAIVSGKDGSEVQILLADLGVHKLFFCNRCKTTITDYHRTCTNCSYNLCLSCCQELIRHSLHGSLKNKRFKKKKIFSSIDGIISKKTISRHNSAENPHPSSMPWQNWEAGSNGSIPCPPSDMGGCSKCILTLKCVYPCTWNRDLEVRAEEILARYHFPQKTDFSSSCSLCEDIGCKNGETKSQKEMYRRIGYEGNYLYCPTFQELHQENLEHFQNHWGKGHPVIIRNMLRRTSSLCWDPVIMFCSYMENKSSETCAENGSKSTKDLDWCEVELDRKRIFMGSLEKRTHASVQQKTLKFKAWLSSHLFKKQFPIHYNEILSSLPLPEYIDPVSGLLNLGVKLPKEFLSPDLGPCIYFSYGSPEGHMQTDFLSKLSYESHDMVNILTYATDAPILPEQISKIENLMKRYKARDHNHGHSFSNSSDQRGKSSLQSEDTGEPDLQDIRVNMHQMNDIAKVPFYSGEHLKDRVLNVEDGNMSDDSESDSEASILCCGSIEESIDSDEYFVQDDIENSCSSEDKSGMDSCGAQWDIFHRKDVPKLLEYLRRHSAELSDGFSYLKHAHPIFDQNLFLDAFHKLKLKEEFDIQPWTFEQYPGEAIFIPAGCPYQIRKLKSCVNVILDFISPENASHCAKLTDEIRHLPLWHKAKMKAMEVRRMALHGIHEALEDVCNQKQVLEE